MMDEKKWQKRKGNYSIGEISRSEMEIQINEINLWVTEREKGSK
jgi:hypothetical protein